MGISVNDLRKRRYDSKWQKKQAVLCNQVMRVKVPAGWLRPERKISQRSYSTAVGFRAGARDMRVATDQILHENGELLIDLFHRFTTLHSIFVPLVVEVGAALIRKVR